MNTYYIYRHIRKDTNEPFYIGLGQVYRKNAQTYKGYYSRAFDNKKRSGFWHSVAEKTEYEVEIIFETDNKELNKQKEVEFIALYGRRDLGLGTLVNMTDGGDGCQGNLQTEELKEWRSKFLKGENNPMFGRKGELSVRALPIREVATGKVFQSKTEVALHLGISLAMLDSHLNYERVEGNQIGFEYVDNQRNMEAKNRHKNTNYRKRKAVIDYNTKEVYDNTAIVAKILGVDFKTLSNKLKGKSNNNTPYLFLEDYEAGFKPNELHEPVKKYNKVINTETLKVYSSLKGMCKETGLNPSTMEIKLKGKRNNDTPFQLLEDYEKGLHINWNVTEKYIKEKKLKDTETGVIYDSIQDAAKAFDINYNTLANYLNPNSPNRNKTSLIYFK